MIQPLTGHRLSSVDGLKIAAAVITFLFHCHIHLGVTFGCLTAFLSQGAVVMDLFFMLSGFALFAVYRETPLTEPAALTRFWGKRLLSIYPLYLVILVTHLLFLDGGSLLQKAVTLPVELLLLQSWFSGLFSYSHNGGTWFLSCLLVGYIVFPFLKAPMERAGKRTLLTTMAAVYILCGFIPAVVVVLGLPNVYSNQLLRLLQFLAGMLLAALLARMKGTARGPVFWAGLAVIGGTGAVLSVSFFAHKGFLTDQYVSYGFVTFPLFLLLIAGSVMAETYGPRRPRLEILLEQAGSWAYPLFMAQFFVWAPVRKILAIYPGLFETHGNRKTFLLALLICVFFTTLLQLGVNRPCQRFFRKRLLTPQNSYKTGV